MDNNLGKYLKNEIDTLSSIGAHKDGGMARLLYDESWVEAQEYIQNKMEEIGLETRYDEIGNLYGILKGKNENETILCGSHVDTVVNGGTLDGQYGIITAYLATEYLKNQYGQPNKSIEVISMAEEEGSRFPYAFWGSKNLVKTANNSDVKNIKDSEGVKFVDAMKNAGFGFRKDDKRREDIKAFLEIHIEQGNVLELEEKSIGIVNSIVGQRRYTVTIKGTANHAGTTPMGYRKDAVYAFSKICSQSIEKAEKEGDPLVLTFGKVSPKPNIVNVVPGEVTFTIDCRHTDSGVLTTFTNDLVRDIKTIVKELDMDVEIDHWMDESPVPMDNQIVQKLEQVANDNKINYKVMHSGAGHDSQIIAPFYPTGLIFVPSIKGISHNPAEETKLVDLVEGVKMYANALYELAYN